MTACKATLLTRLTHDGTPYNWLKRGGVLAILVGMSTACTTSPEVKGPQMHVTVTRSATALPGETYTWVDMPAQREAESDPRVTDAALRGRLRGALDGALQGKGYRLADDPAKADFIVAYRVGVRDVEEVAMIDKGGKGGTPATGVPEAAIECGGEGCSQLVTRVGAGTPVMKMKTAEAVEGGLLVEVLEPRTIRVLWSAYNRGTVPRDAASQSGLDGIARSTLAALPAK